MVVVVQVHASRLLVGGVRLGSRGVVAMPARWDGGGG